MKTKIFTFSALKLMAFEICESGSPTLADNCPFTYRILII